MSDGFFGTSAFPPLGPVHGSSGSITPSGWDRATLGSRVIPGFCKITHGGVRLKVDRKPKAGADGANPTCHGVDPQAIHMEITTYSDDDREILASILAPLVPQQGITPPPVAIDHPSLRMLGVYKVQITGMTALTPVAPMIAKCTVEMLHWLPTKADNATTTPKGAAVRNIKNVRAGSNPAPTQQAGFGGPPPGLKSN